MRRISIIIAFFLVFLKAAPVDASIWNVTSIDTMKISRDRARDNSYTERVSEYVEMLSQIGPSHISIGTPYNDEFYTVLRRWVEAVHARDINVWFRGNWSEWEGWFEYKQLTDPTMHHEMTYEFIVKNPQLFRDGDIFTPAPEPENGVLGDPRESNEAKERYLEFIKNSLAGCREAFKVIDVKVNCSYYSTNGDIAREIITPELADTLQAVTVDHYVRDASTYPDFVEQLNEIHSVPVVFGELGAPIPDLHGELNGVEQARFVREVLWGIYSRGGMVEGVNYWTAFDGSTSIFDEEGNEKEVVDTLKDFYMPSLIRGRVVTYFSLPVRNAVVNVNGKELRTDDEGRFETYAPAGRIDIQASHKIFSEAKTTLVLERLEEGSATITLKPSIRKFIENTARFN